MADELFVLNNGEAIITPNYAWYGPSCDSGRDINPVRNITVKLGNRYHKLRGIELDRASEVKRRAGNAFNPDLWISCGAGDNEILIDKASFKSVSPYIVNAAKRKKILEILVNCCQVSSQVVNLTRSNKITCIMNHEGNLEIVEKADSETGSYKIVKKADLLWKIDTSWTRGITKGVAKPQKALDQIDEKDLKDHLLKHTWISELLIENGVPRILLYQQIPRNDPNKDGLEMHWCEGGNLRRYISTHFNASTQTLLPHYREQHIALMRQVIETVCEMHKQTGLIHCDIKTQNVLIKTTSREPQAILSDFDLVMPKDSWFYDIPGTFPPPELNSGTRIQITEAIDAWAFGVVLFETMHQSIKLVDQLRHYQSATRVEAARKTIVDQILNPNDPVDQIIALLLAKDPSKRITLEYAKELLEKAS